MKKRWDGSVLSENFPSIEFSKKFSTFAILRVILTGIQYTDSNKNIYKGTQAPEVTYSGVILGGISDGQALTNIRDASALSGESGNYGEKIYKVCSKPFFGKNAVPVEKQDGALVYVAFLDGNYDFPIIIGKAKGVLDRTFTGATKADGPRTKWQYNGNLFEINKNGEFTFTHKGGTYNSTSNTFEPNETANKTQIQVKDDILTVSTEGGATVSINGTTKNITLQVSQTILEIDGNSGKISLKGQYVDLGAQVAELATKFTSLATAYNSHIHPYTDDGSPSLTSPPTAPLSSSVGSRTVKVAD